MVSHGAMVTKVSSHCRSRAMFLNLVCDRVRDNVTSGLSRAIISIGGDNNKNFFGGFGFYGKILGAHLGSIGVGQLGTICAIEFGATLVARRGRVNAGFDIPSKGAMACGNVGRRVNCYFPVGGTYFIRGVALFVGLMCPGLVLFGFFAGRYLRIFYPYCHAGGCGQGGNYGVSTICFPRRRGRWCPGRQGLYRGCGRVVEFPFCQWGRWGRGHHGGSNAGNAMDVVVFQDMGRDLVWVSMFCKVVIGGVQGYVDTIAGDGDDFNFGRAWVIGRVLFLWTTFGLI